MTETTNRLTDACSDKCALALKICMVSSILTFITSTASNNISQVDKLWSIIPIVYALIFTSSDNIKTHIMATLVFIWGIRLTYNFYRRGGYKFPRIWLGEEDYRWSYIRKGFFHPMISSQNHVIIWTIFNLLFISFYQNILLLLMVSPSYVVCCSISDNNDNDNNFTILDGVAIFLFLTFIIIETKADQEQWEFQIEKHRRININKSSNSNNDNKQQQKVLHKDGFCQTGLFSIVRKPNYAAEQGIWMSYYLFSISSSKSIINTSITGCLLLILLFQGSGWFTEKISIKKYPRYIEYKKRVPLYIPNNISSIVLYFNPSPK